MDSLDLMNNLPRGVGRWARYALAELEPIRRALSLEQQVLVAPDRANAVVGPGATYEHKFAVPPGSLITGFSGSSVQPEGCTVQLLDAGTGAQMFDKPVDLANATGQGYPGGIANGAGVVQQIKLPLALLARPRVVVEPGWLKLQIRNLAPLANDIQVCMWVVTPPAEGAPRNEWNALLDHEADLARRARRSGGVGGTGAPIVGPGGFVVGGTDPLDLPATPLSFDVTAAAPGTNILIPGTSGYRIAIYALDLQALDANTFQLLNGAKNLRGLISLAEGGGYMRQISGPKEPHWVLDDGASFAVTVSAAGRFAGDLQYRMLERWGS